MILEQVINNTPQIIRLSDALATHDLGKELGQVLTPGTIILLTGDLGAGKTTLVQGIAEGLGINEPIVSPTFTLINEYLEGRIPLYHIDLYRLEPQEIEGLYLENYWEGIEVELGITAIEWPERLLIKPPHYLSIELTFREQYSRQARLIYH